MMKQRFQVQIAVMLVVALLAAAVAPIRAEQMTLVEKGAPKACIVLADEPTAGDLKAADQLRQYIDKMSGVKLPIVRKGKETAGVEIRLGKACGALEKEAGREDGFTIQTGKGVLNIKGVNDRGTLYGVFDFLEGLGVRWFLPGELGEVVPKRETITIDSLSCKEEPSVPIRWVGKQGEWSAHARSNVLEDSTGLHINGSFHTFSQFMPADKYFAEHPEWFALVHGKRKYTEGKPHVQKLCTSNPDMVREFIRNCRAMLDKDPSMDVLSVSPGDGLLFCECDACQALCEPGFPTAVDVNRRREQFPNWNGALSRRYMIFYLQVAEAIRKSHPGDKVMVGAYSGYSAPPNDPSLKYPDNVYVMVTHGGCHNHSLTDDTCAINKDFRKKLEGWSAKAPGGLFIYEYYNKVASVDCPFPIVHTIRRDLPYYHAIGLKGFFTQYGSYWIVPLRFYLPARLLWDADADVDALLSDYYERFWGPAGPAMRAYDERLEKAAADYGGHMCVPTFELPLLFTDAALADCESSLRAAEKAADNDILRQRVAKIRLSHEWTKMAVDYVKEIRRVAAEVDKMKLSKKQLARTLEEKLAAAQKKSDALRKFINQREGRDVFRPSTNYIKRFLQPEHVFGNRIRKPDDARGD